MAEHSVDLLKQWLKRSRESQLAHYAAAEQSSTKHLWIGIPAAAFSAVVGTTVFAALDSATGLDIRLRVLVALISVLTAILTGCQTFLRYSDRAEAHRTAATKYAELRRRIEQNLSFPDKITEEAVTSARTSFDAITEAAPNVSSSLWKRAVAAAGDDYFIPGSKP